MGTNFTMQGGELTAVDPEIAKDLCGLNIMISFPQSSVSNYVSNLDQLM